MRIQHKSEKNKQKKLSKKKTVPTSYIVLNNELFDKN